MQWKMGQPWNMETHSAMKLNLVRVDRGWHPTQLCGDYKKPWGSLSYKQSVFHWTYIKQFFFRGEKNSSLSPGGFTKWEVRFPPFSDGEKRREFCSFSYGPHMGPFYSELLKRHRVKSQKRFPTAELPSRELTYPTLGNGNSPSKLPWKGIC